LIGSCAYMAAERFSGGPVGPQSDVYSLACVLYESLTGQPPFECADVQQLMSAHTFAPPPRPSIMRRGIGRAFDDVIAVGMAKQPAARFRSSGELAAAATAAAWRTPVPTPVPAPVAPGPPSPTGTRAFNIAYPNPEDTGYSPYPVALPPWVKPRRSRVPLAIIGAAAVLLLVAGVLTAISALGNGDERQTASAAPSIPTSSTAPSTKTPSLSRPVQGADGWGFVGQPARCDPGNPPAAVVRTSLSLAVICQTGSGNFYYRGERIRDGAHIEISNAVRSSGGFDATNPADGTRYEVRPQRLTIVSNGHVDSSETVLQYASAAN
jgi:serine/threonine protein kinase